jgi:hypothetical protein
VSETLIGETSHLSFRYTLYGLTLASEWSIAGLVETSASPVRIQLRTGEAALFDRAHSSQSRPFGPPNWFQRTVLRDQTELLEWPKLFEFLLSTDGSTILGRPLKQGSEAAFEVYLLGQVLSFALVKLGIEPIHGTAVTIGDSAVGFIGDCTYGKSTMAAAFLKHGCSLLTDDQLVTSQNSEGDVVVQPGPPRIKLLPESAHALLGAHTSGARMNPFTNKMIIRLDANMSRREPAPLRAIYVLSDPGNAQQEVKINPLSPREGCIDLLRNTFNPVVSEPARIKHQFQAYSELSTQVPMRSLSYPRDFSRISEVVDAVIDDVRGLTAHAMAPSSCTTR